MSALASAFRSMFGRRFGIDANNRICAAGQPYSITMVAAADGSNKSMVTCTVVDFWGNPIADVFNFDLWLSDDAAGQGLTGTTASGAVAARAAGGTDLVVEVAKKATRVQTLKTGIYVLSITDTGKSAFVIAAQVPFVGRTVAGVTLATGSYG